MILKLGSNGPLVILLQEFLKIKPDGDFGPKTKTAVENWQKQNGLKDDGVVGPLTWAAMGIATTDNSETTTSKKKIEFGETQFYLPTGEYFPGPTKKMWMFLHHTAGWENPQNTVSVWANDDRGPVATEFVIGGQSIRGKDKSQDGKLVQAFPEGGYGWHLGLGKIPIHVQSVGVEVCNFGQLTKGGYFKYVNKKYVWQTLKPNSYYTYVGVEADPSQIVVLSEKFRGYDVWHKYSDKQIETLKELIKDVAERDNIDMRNGIYQLIKSMGVAKAFDFCDPNYAISHPGLWTHANVIKGKFDMFPQEELVDMLMTL